MQKFNYHSHTYRCRHLELEMKDEEHIQEYIKMKFKKIAFTDHCPEKNETDKRTNIRKINNRKIKFYRKIEPIKRGH